MRSKLISVKKMLFVKLTLLTAILLNDLSAVKGARRPNKFKQHLDHKINRLRQRATETICYDSVGCFEVPHKRSPLQKMPQSPDFLQTKFYLLTPQTNFSNPEIIFYEDGGASLARSRFDYSRPLKLFVHGYLGKWNDHGYLIGANAYLKIEDCNVVLTDWAVGAQGPQYVTSAANTEVVGRQLGLLLLQMVEKGLDPDKIHLLGFSLGAHVAGTASEVLKKKGYLIGRITGLDAASPLFRTDHLREKHKKLDKSDARFVDVIHTDGSPVVTDGFGLWEPIGHVDFFPNGGEEQPGCNDLQQSIVISHFDKSLTRDIACSHIRAWRLFEETLLTKSTKSPGKCEFTAFSCRGGRKAFNAGYCFPLLPPQNASLQDFKLRSDIGRFGEDVKGAGVLFFLTRSNPPFCGTQLQASIHTSPNIGAVKGFFLLSLNYSGFNTTFQIFCNLDKYSPEGAIVSGLGVADYNSLTGVNKISAKLRFVTERSEEEKNSTYTTDLHIDKVVVRDMFSKSWQHCEKNLNIKDSTSLKYDYTITLKSDNCW